jgi:alcohol dehydrogenase class IV
MMMGFEFFLPVRIKFGAGILETVGHEYAQLSTGNVLLVIDQNLIGVQAYDTLIASLSKENITPCVFTDFTPNPDEASIDRGLAELRNNNCNGLIGFGGGSAMDVARAIAISATVSGPIRQYEGINTLSESILPLINIPTTAGTGSEVSATTVITNNEEKRKYIVKSPFAFARAAILDPEVLGTLPESIAASAGMDAIIHAVESYISRSSSPMSEMFAITSLKLASKSIRAFVADRSNLEAAADMLMASMLAAISMAQAGLGIVHALANTLGGQFHSPHGLTCALLLSDCLQEMTGDAVDKFAAMAKILVPDARYAEDSRYAEQLPNIFRQLLADLKLETGLRQLGVTEGDLDRVIKHTSAVVASFSPRAFDSSDMKQILKQAL